MGIWIVLGVILALIVTYVLLGRFQKHGRSVDACRVAEVRTDALALDVLHRYGMTADDMRTRSHDDRDEPRTAD